MSKLTHEQQVLVALAKEHAESRRPMKMMIVLAACNARSGIQQDAVLVALSSLKRRGLVVQHADRWEVSADGHMDARQLTTGSPLAKPATKPATKAADPLRSKVKIAVAPPAPAPAPTPAAPEVAGTGAGQPLPEITYPAQVERLGTPLFADLLERCAAMHLVLLAQAREARKAGDPSADRELAWLIETGEQLLQAGGGV